MKHIGTASMRKSLHTCSLCLHWWKVPHFALKYPCNPPPPPGRPSLGDRLPPPPPGRPSHANPGVCKGGKGCYAGSACGWLEVGTPNWPNLYHLFSHSTSQNLHILKYIGLCCMAKHMAHNINNVATFCRPFGSIILPFLFIS